MNISFFIPAYNCAATVAESVDSIMETNFTPGDELIIVNDCSKDTTQEVLDLIKKKYSIVKIITHSKNKGGSAARNTAVQNSSNELLFCLDSDNVLAKNSITPLKKELLDKAADIASFQDMRYFNTDRCSDTKYIWRFLPLTTLADFMADHKNPGSSGNYLFTKESWLDAGGYPEFAGALDTWGFCFRQLASGSKLISLPKSYYFHRYGTDSYYIRDMNINNMSSIAWEIILPFKQLLYQEDIEYITGDENKLVWFENYHSRPIRTKDCKVGRKAMSIDLTKKNLFYKAAKKIYNKLTKTLK